MGRLITVNVDNISVGGKGDVDAGAQVKISDKEYDALVAAGRFSDGTLTDDGEVSLDDLDELTARVEALEVGGGGGGGGGAGLVGQGAGDVAQWNGTLEGVSFALGQITNHGINTPATPSVGENGDGLLVALKSGLYALSYYSVEATPSGAANTITGQPMMYLFNSLSPVDNDEILFSGPLPAADSADVTAGNYTAFGGSGRHWAYFEVVRWLDEDTPVMPGCVVPWASAVNIGITMRALAATP